MHVSPGCSQIVISAHSFANCDLTYSFSCTRSRVLAMPVGSRVRNLYCVIAARSRAHSIIHPPTHSRSHSRSLPLASAMPGASPAPPVTAAPQISSQIPPQIPPQMAPTTTTAAMVRRKGVHAIPVQVVMLAASANTHTCFRDVLYLGMCFTIAVYFS